MFKYGPGKMGSEWVLTDMFIAVRFNPHECSLTVSRFKVEPILLIDVKIRVPFFTG